MSDLLVEIENYSGQRFYKKDIGQFREKTFPKVV